MIIKLVVFVSNKYMFTFSNNYLEIFQLKFIKI